MRLKLIGELAEGIWKAASGNEYAINAEGVLEIPEDNGADLEEAKGCGLFEIEPEADRIGGSIGLTEP